MKNKCELFSGISRYLSVSVSLCLSFSSARTDLAFGFFFLVQLNEGKCETKKSFSCLASCCRLIQVSRNIRWCMYQAHLAANVIALELVAGCWLNGISGIFARVFMLLRLGRSNDFAFLSLWAHQSMRDQLYHFNSPECVRFLLILFSLRVNFWFFINDFFSSCNYFIFFAN